MQNGDQSQSGPKSGQTLNWILALVIMCVAGAIGWVGWNFIESLQNNAGKMNNFNRTANNTKIDSHHLDIVKNEIDGRMFADQLAPSEDLQAALVKREGSELVFSQALLAMDKKQFGQAAQYYSQVLAMLPAEAKTKSSWFAYGATADQRTYTMWTYRLRAQAYREKGDYEHAFADLTEAIKIKPQIAFNYKQRAALNYQFGRKKLGDADTKKMIELSR